MHYDDLKTAIYRFNPKKLANFINDYDTLLTLWVAKRYDKNRKVFYFFKVLDEVSQEYIIEEHYSEDQIKKILTEEHETEDEKMFNDLISHHEKGLMFTYYER